MLYQNTQQIFWNNQSLEKPDNAMINNYYNTWNELGANVSYEITTTSLSFNISATNTNFNVNYKWFKLVDANNNTYYYFLDSWSLHGITYTVNLVLDIWSTYIAQYFDSTNLTNTHYVYFNQKQKTNKNLWFKPLQKEAYLFNIYSNHSNLSKITTNHWSNTQGQSDWAMVNTYNYNSAEVTYYTYLYKVNLMSGSETVYTGMVDNLTFISFSPVAANSNSKSWNNGYWNWYKLVQSTTAYDLDLVELPFDLSSVENVNSTNEFNWTRNIAISNEGNLNCYYLDYSGEKVNISFAFLNQAQNTINGYNQTLTEQIAFDNFYSNVISFYWQLGDIVPFSFLEIVFPYLMNFRSFSLSYMLQEFSFNFSNFSQINYFFLPDSWVFNFVPNYPTLMLNVHINTFRSYTGMSTLIGSFNFMNANITNTLSVSNNFLSQNKNIIQTAHSMVQNQSSIMLSNETLSHWNLFDDLMHPVKTLESGIDTALNNQNLWKQYSMNYGSAKLAQLSKSNSITSAGTNAGLVANILFLNNTALQQFEVIKVVSDIDKYGYIYENWDYLNTWYVKYFHNFVKISTGLEKLFSANVPNSLISECLQILANGVIIWSNLFDGNVRYFDVKSIFDNGLTQSTFTNFVNTYYYNAEKDYDNGNTN